MRSLSSFVRRRSLRFRITSTFVLGSALLAGALSVSTVVLVGRFLEDQRVRSSTRQSLFAVLFAREFLAARPDVEELVAKLQIRQSFDAMATSGGDWFATSIELTPDVVSPELRSLVAEEKLGYEIETRGRNRFLVYGTPLPPKGVDLFLFFPLEDIDRTMDLLVRAMAAGGLVVVGLAAVSARQVSRRILSPLSAVSRATQRVAEGLLETRVDAVSADELGQLAASFNQMAEALHDLIQRERAFVAAVSHELRTPLAALHAAGEVVSRYRDRLPAEGAEAIDLMREDVVALRELVDELMEVSELDSGRAVVRVEEVQLRSFVEALLARRHRTSVVEGGDVMISTDKARLARIVGNLVDNAFVHGEGRDVRVLISDQEGSAVVTVVDNGPGIEHADLDRLFDRFYKPDRSRSRDRGGVGLGLAIARENARLLGGSIDVTSEPGKGASFALKLPLNVDGPAVSR